MKLWHTFCALNITCTAVCLYLVWDIASTNNSSKYHAVQTVLNHVTRSMSWLTGIVCGYVCVCVCVCVCQVLTAWPSGRYIQRRWRHVIVISTAHDVTVWLGVHGDQVWSSMLVQSCLSPAVSRCSSAEPLSRRHHWLRESSVGVWSTVARAGQTHSRRYAWHHWPHHRSHERNQYFAVSPVYNAIRTGLVCVCMLSLLLLDIITNTTLIGCCVLLNFGFPFYA